jgi:hypothetical protein
VTGVGYLHWLFEAKKRRGAFWKDRYHATTIAADEHLHRCLVYIDLNMVRAGVFKHPSEWAHNEIQEPPERYGIIDLRALRELSEFSEVVGFQRIESRIPEAAPLRLMSGASIAIADPWLVVPPIFVEYDARPKFQYDGMRCACREVDSSGSAGISISC